MKPSVVMLEIIACATLILVSFVENVCLFYSTRKCITGHLQTSFFSDFQSYICPTHEKLSGERHENCLFLWFHVGFSWLQGSALHGSPDDLPGHLAHVTLCVALPPEASPNCPPLGGGSKPGLSEAFLEGGCCALDGWCGCVHPSVNLYWKIRTLECREWSIPLVL